MSNQKNRGGKNKRHADEVKISSSSASRPAAIENGDGSGIVDELMNFKRQLETDLVKTIICEKTPAKGTVVIAKKDIPAGTTILAEPAIAWQPLEDRIMSVCHHCMTEVPRYSLPTNSSSHGEVIFVRLYALYTNLINSHSSAPATQMGGRLW
jgi:hypothetical protein